MLVRDCEDWIYAPLDLMEAYPGRSAVLAGMVGLAALSVFAYHCDPRFRTFLDSEIGGMVLGGSTLLGVVAVAWVFSPSVRPKKEEKDEYEMSEVPKTPSPLKEPVRARKDWDATIKWKYRNYDYLLSKKIDSEQEREAQSDGELCALTQIQKEKIEFTLENPDHEGYRLSGKQEFFEGTGIYIFVKENKRYLIDENGAFVELENAKLLELMGDLQRPFFRQEPQRPEGEGPCQLRR